VKDNADATAKLEKTAIANTNLKNDCGRWKSETLTQ
jgi:hypothetical protein